MGAQHAERQKERARLATHLLQKEIEQLLGRQELLEYLPKIKAALRAEKEENYRLKLINSIFEAAMNCTPSVNEMSESQLNLFQNDLIGEITKLKMEI